ncbi:MAG: hypothetical protein JWP97_5348 [Labilithrix sp.]|nr:hypothetical protein [Labilithrix sp.]
MQDGSQLALPLRVPGRGGARRNAGRKPLPPGQRRTAHRARPRLSPYTPVHITLRGARGLPSFRSQVMARATGGVIRAMKSARDDLRIVEFSIQSNHLHLVVEADDERALSSAIRGFQTRVSRRLNHHVLRRRRGPIWGDRYHREDLTSRRQARNALVYALQNSHHHGVVEPGVRDPLSSALCSERFIQRPVLPPDTSPCSRALTFMLNHLWQSQWPGLISPAEVPRGRADPPTRLRSEATRARPTDAACIALPPAGR